MSTSLWSARSTPVGLVINPIRFPTTTEGGWLRNSSRPVLTCTGGEDSVGWSGPFCENAEGAANTATPSTTTRICTARLIVPPHRAPGLVRLHTLVRRTGDISCRFLTQISTLPYDCDAGTGA